MLLKTRENPHIITTAVENNIQLIPAEENIKVQPRVIEKTEDIHKRNEKESTSENNSVKASQKKTDVSEQKTTRSGRVIRKPKRFENDY